MAARRTVHRIRNAVVARCLKLPSLDMVYRPWGFLSWLLDKLAITNWELLGCLALEERSLAALETLSISRVIHAKRFWVIRDPARNYSSRQRSTMSARRQAFVTLGGHEKDIEEHELFERAEEMVSSVEGFL